MAERDVKYYENAIKKLGYFFLYSRVAKNSSNHRVQIKSGTYQRAFGLGLTQLEAVRNAYKQLLEIRQEQISCKPWDPKPENKADWKTFEMEEDPL